MGLHKNSRFKEMYGVLETRPRTTRQLMAHFNIPRVAVYQSTARIRKVLDPTCLNIDGEYKARREPDEILLAAQKGAIRGRAYLKSPRNVILWLADSLEALPEAQRPSYYPRLNAAAEMLKTADILIGTFVQESRLLTAGHQ